MLCWVCAICCLLPLGNRSLQLDCVLISRNGETSLQSNVLITSEGVCSMLERKITTVLICCLLSSVHM